MGTITASTISTELDDGKHYASSLDFAAATTWFHVIKAPVVEQLFWVSANEVTKRSQPCWMSIELNFGDFIPVELQYKFKSTITSVEPFIIGSMSTGKFVPREGKLAPFTVQAPAKQNSDAAKKKRENDLYGHVRTKFNLIHQITFEYIKCYWKPIRFYYQDVNEE